MVERFSTDVAFVQVPRSGIEAYYMVIALLSSEIEEKTAILAEMENETVKQKFIRGWTPGITNVNIHV